MLLAWREKEVYTNSICYDEEVSRVLIWYTKFPGKEYTFQPVSHQTNLFTLNVVETACKVNCDTFGKYILLVYLVVRMQRKINTFSILSPVM